MHTNHNAGVHLIVQTSLQPENLPAVVRVKAPNAALGFECPECKTVFICSEIDMDQGHHGIAALPAKPEFPEGGCKLECPNCKRTSVFQRFQLIYVRDLKLQRRSATRHHFGAIAEVLDLDQTHEVVSLIRDLSLTGCFVKTTTPFREGTRVRLRIAHSGAAFAATGRVTANVTATGMGIAFTQMELKDRAILEGWLGT